MSKFTVKCEQLIDSPQGNIVNLRKPCKLRLIKKIQSGAGDVAQWGLACVIDSWVNLQHNQTMT